MGKLFEIVKKHIDIYDYCCLLEGGAPIDEFDFESHLISERISCLDTPEDIARVMAMIFQKRFGREEKAEAFIKVAKAIANDIEEEQQVILEEAKPTAYIVVSIIE